MAIDLLLGCLCRPVIKWAFGREDTRVWYRETMFSQMVSYEFLLHGALHGYFLLGCLCGPVIKWAFGRRCGKVVARGREDTRVWYRETMFSRMVSYEFLLHGALHGYFLLGCLWGPVIKWAFGRLRPKTASRGREDTRVWYGGTMFSQMVSYEFLLYGALHGYFLYLVSAPPEKPTRRCEPEEDYLRCPKRFDDGSHSIIFLLFEVKSVR